jgi:putative membrane protein
MKSTLLGTIVLSTAALCFAPVSTALAQAPGSGQSTPQSTPQTSPSAPGAPGAPGTTAQTPGTLPETTPASQKVDDKSFLKHAAIGGLEEVELGKLAQQKASSDAVKQFGERMVTDHTKANDQLKEVAGKENVAVPTTLDKKGQSRIDKLSKLSGPQFDKAYMKDQVKDHEKDVREFQQEAQNGTNPAIKQFASQTLPILQQHLELAKSTDKTAKTETASTKQ